LGGWRAALNDRNWVLQHQTTSQAHAAIRDPTDAAMKRVQQFVLSLSPE
jgi:hypothetical protein